MVESEDWGESLQLRRRGWGKKKEQEEKKEMKGQPGFRLTGTRMDGCEEEE